MDGITYFYLGIQTMCSIGFLIIGFKLIELIKSLIDILKEELKDLE